MACDLLSVQPYRVASKSIFSLDGRVIFQRITKLNSIGRSMTLLEHNASPKGKLTKHRTTNTWGEIKECWLNIPHKNSPS